MSLYMTPKGQTLSTMASSPTTAILDESLISPPPGSVPDTSIPLTAFDLPWIHASVNRLFFFPSTSDATPLIESLKSSLSLTLQLYYILAGTVRPLPDSDDQFEIFYKDGDAVPFTIAQSNEDFRYLSSGQKRDYSRILSLIPLQTTALLAVKATLFPNHGVCIAVAIRHVTGDGSSTVGFLKSWASACRSGEPCPATPIYSRSPPPDSHALRRAYSELRLMPPDRTTASDSGVYLTTYTLGRQEIEKLKQRVREHGENIHVSTFAVSCAYTLVCLVRARGYSSDRTAHFGFAVDLRKRLDPPLPASYFGNCLGLCFVEENVGVLKAGDGVVAASLAIGKAIQRLSAGALIGVEEWGSKLRAIINERPLSVSGSPKLGVYEVDFGWGRPLRVDIPSIRDTGAMSLAETREGDGGVEIGLVLEEKEMDQFGSQFYGGLG